MILNLTSALGLFRHLTSSAKNTLVINVLVIGLVAHSLMACKIKDSESEQFQSIKEVREIIVGSTTREFIVYLPAEVQQLDTVPAVFMLHGTGGDGEKFYNFSQWKEKADQENFIAVFPSALIHCFRQDRNLNGELYDPGELRVESKWAAGDLGEPHMPLCTDEEVSLLSSEQQALVDHPLADDVLFIDSILNVLTVEYNVDMNRVYASGFSNGGVMTSRLSAELSYRFASVAAAAGVLSVDPIQARPHSFVFSVGTDDSRFMQLFDVSEIPLTEALFNEVPDFGPTIVDPLLATLQFRPTYQFSEMTINSVNVSQFQFSDSINENEDEFVVLVIDDLEHQYPNGTNHPVILADYLWEFFKQKSIAGF